MTRGKEREACIVCGKTVETGREGRVHDACYTLGVALAAQEGDDG